MPHNEVDPSLITNEPCKQKLPSYATNEDNISADKEEVVKRMKCTVDPCGYNKMITIFLPILTILRCLNIS
jgi:hypothetical protein